MSRTDDRRIPWHLTNSVASGMLSFVFIVLLVITGAILIGAFVMFGIGILSVVSVMRTALAQPPMTLEQAQPYLMQLESLGRTALDSGLMQFLFQLFSGALVIVGVYLLDRAYTDITQVEQQAEAKLDEVRQEIDIHKNGTAETIEGIQHQFAAAQRRNALTWSIMGQLHTAYFKTVDLYKSADEQGPARQAIEHAAEICKEAKLDGLKLETEQFNACLAQLTSVLNNIDRLRAKPYSAANEVLTDLLKAYQPCEISLLALAPDSDAGSQA